MTGNDARLAALTMSRRRLMQAVEAVATPLGAGAALAGVDPLDAKRKQLSLASDWANIVTALQGGSRFGWEDDLA